MNGPSRLMICLINWDRVPSENFCRWISFSFSKAKTNLADECLSPSAMRRRIEIACQFHQQNCFPPSQISFPSHVRTWVFSNVFYPTSATESLTSHDLGSGLVSALRQTLTVDCLGGMIARLSAAACAFPLTDRCCFWQRGGELAIPVQSKLSISANFMFYLEFFHTHVVIECCYCKRFHFTIVVRTSQINDLHPEMANVKLKASWDKLRWRW